MAINSTSFVITGGSSGDFAKTVELYNTETGQWIELPEMRVGRYDHGCVTAEYEGQFAGFLSIFLYIEWNAKKHGKSVSS